MGQPRGSLSNRKGTIPKFGNPQATVGVDKLALSFPVDWAEGDPASWDSDDLRYPGQPGETLRRGVNVECLGGSVFVGFQLLPEEARHRPWGKAEWNPIRLLEPGEYRAATVEESMSTVGAVFNAVKTRMRPLWDDPLESNLKRVDVNRDFEGVDETPATIRALGALHRPWSRLNQTHADPKRHGAQTLLVGSGAGVVRLYDKHAETKGDAPEGTVRWEAECRAWAGKYGGMTMLGDLNEVSAMVLAKNRFEWSGMGSEVAGSLNRLVGVVASCEYLTPTQAMSFLGYLVCQSAGGSLAPVSKNTLTKYRRLQRELGIVAPADFGSMIEVVRRLDWDSGREVVNVRAA